MDYIRFKKKTIWSIPYNLLFFSSEQLNEGVLDVSMATINSIPFITIVGGTGTVQSALHALTSIQTMANVTGELVLQSVVNTLSSTNIIVNILDEINIDTTQVTLASKQINVVPTSNTVNLHATVIVPPPVLPMDVLPINYFLVIEPHLVVAGRLNYAVTLTGISYLEETVRTRTTIGTSMDDAYTLDVTAVVGILNPFVIAVDIENALTITTAGVTLSSTQLSNICTISSSQYAHVGLLRHTTLYDHDSKTLADMDTYTLWELDFVDV